ncbi:hypothetical protein [uncultured Dokdonia sp.]|uniref:hypothetical protein n=1 Tax=uncultured Dokdonia sp. TaxID=575653 RepID=UPI0026123AEC|nr:hypothetical protein [uncultured Dokdonia sp.]
MIETEMNIVDFAQRQKHIQQEGIANILVNNTYTGIDKGKPMILLHDITTYSFVNMNVIYAFAKIYRVIFPKHPLNFLNS